MVDYFLWSQGLVILLRDKEISKLSTEMQKI